MSHSRALSRARHSPWTEVSHPPIPDFIALAHVKSQYKLLRTNATNEGKFVAG